MEPISLTVVALMCGYFATFVSVSVASEGMDVNFQSSQEGYMLKPLYNKHLNRSQSTHKESFIVFNNQQDSHLLHAKFGPFEIYQTVPKALVTRGARDTPRLSGTHHSVIDDMDISVHIMDYPEGKPGTRLRVLFHISRNKQIGHASPYSFFARGSLWCARVYVQCASRLVSARCVLKDTNRVCIAELVPPSEWWRGDGKATMDVSYSVARTENARECTRVTNSVIPDASLKSPRRDKSANFLAKIALRNETKTYSELQDHFVVIKVPERPLAPGSTLFVPIQLEAGSDLKMFIVRVRARSGMKILGAEVVKGSNWDIFVDVNDRQRSATVTASIKDIQNYKTPKKKKVPTATLR